MTTRALPARVVAAVERGKSSSAPAPSKSKPVRRRGVMNKTEARYAVELVARKRMGEVRWWRFEGMTLRIANGARYTPDFTVLPADGPLEFVEIKAGVMHEASIVRLKVAASLYPFRFVLVRFARGETTTTEIRP